MGYFKTEMERAHAIHAVAPCPTNCARTPTLDGRAARRRQMGGGSQKAVPVSEAYIYCWYGNVRFERATRDGSAREDDLATVSQVMNGSRA